MSTFEPMDGLGAGTGLLEPPEEARPRRSRAAGGGGSEPPWNFGGDGGGGGDPWWGGDEEPQEQASELPPGTGELALGLFLMAVVTLFLVFLATYLIYRQHAEVWPPEGFPGAPEGLWLSTLLLVASSATLHRGTLELARPDRAQALRWLGATTILGSLFLGAQWWVWQSLLVEGLAIDTNLYGMTFYALTALHAVHVLGGLCVLARLVWRVRRAMLLGAAAPRPSARLVAIYWHFMGAVWLLLFGVLYLLR